MLCPIIGCSQVPRDLNVGSMSTSASRQRRRHRPVHELQLGRVNRREHSIAHQCVGEGVAVELHCVFHQQARRQTLFQRVDDVIVRQLRHVAQHV